MAMKRRDLLAVGSGTTALALAGCPDALASSPEDDEGEALTPVDREPGEPEGEGCGPASLPLSELLTDRIGDQDACFEGAEPSLVIQNERAAAVEASVDLDAEGGLSGTYSLDPGERAVEPSAFVTAESVSGTVTVDDEEWAVEWPERACYRYGIAIVPDAVEIGWVQPIQGPGDTQHDCYPGTPLDLEIGAIDGEWTVTATVTDRCTVTDREETVTVSPDGRRRLEDVFESGGVYDVTIDVDGGGSTTKAFREVCWGVSATVEADGGIRLHQLEID